MLATAILCPMMGLPAYEPLAAVVLTLLVAMLAVRALGMSDLNPVSGVGKLSQVGPFPCSIQPSLEYALYLSRPSLLQLGSATLTAFMIILVPAASFFATVGPGILPAHSAVNPASQLEQAFLVSACQVQPQGWPCAIMPASSCPWLCAGCRSSLPLWLLARWWPIWWLEQ